MQAKDSSSSKVSAKQNNNKREGKEKVQQCQQTISQFISLPLSKSRKKDITDAVVYWLTKDGLPLYTIEKAGYQHMMSVLERRYDIPSRKTLARKVETKYENAQKCLQDYIKKELDSKKSFFCSLTTDMWSSNTTDPYMAVTMHYVTEDWDLQSKLLQCAYIPGSHTGDMLADALMECLCEWGLAKTTNISSEFGASLPCVSGVVTDNGANIVKACSNLQVNKIPCFGHCLNLAVNKGLADDRIKKALSAVRKLCGHFAHSSIQQKLRDAQDAMEMPRKKLKNDCETRLVSQL